jgi:hypothetical protein
MAEEKVEKKTRKFFGFGMMGQVFFCVMAAIFLAISTYAFIFFIFAMIPTIVTMFIDNRPGKYATSTVGAFNFMGVIPYFLKMIEIGEINQSGKALITDINTWFFIYGTASVGWVMIWSIPQIVSLFYHVKMQKKVIKIKENQEALVKVWGDNLTKY